MISSIRFGASQSTQQPVKKAPPKIDYAKWGYDPEGEGPDITVSRQVFNGSQNLPVQPVQED